VGLFEQRFQPIPQLDAIPCQLILGPRQGAPEALFRIGHKAEPQLIGDQPFHEALAIREVSLPAPRRAIGLRLRQMEGAGPSGGGVSLLGERLPVSFQGRPHGLPILRGRFHHDFYDVLLDQPLGQGPQLGRSAAKLATVKREFADDFHIRHHHREHPFVHVDSCDPVRHRRCSSGRARRACLQVL
jgi:hypothetical protein